MSSLNSRLKGLGFGSKRKSSAVAAPTTSSPDPNPTSTPPLPPLPGATRPIDTPSSSTSSLPMNQPGAVGRPPSYTNNFAPNPAAVGRTASPMVGGTPRTPPTTHPQAASHPPQPKPREPTPAHPRPAVSPSSALLQTHPFSRLYSRQRSYRAPRRRPAGRIAADEDARRLIMGLNEISTYQLPFRAFSNTTFVFHIQFFCHD